MVLQRTIGIIALDPKDEDHVQITAHLHSTLLPGSPIALLGPVFMRKFYYSRLVQDGLIHCDLYEYQGEAVGLIAYTRYPGDFLSRGLHKHFFYLAGIMIWTIFQRPSRIMQITQALGMTWNRNKEKSHEKKIDGEILSLGVLPQYRDRKFIGRTGISIPRELFQHVKDYFRQQNIATIRMFVEQDNREAVLFYHSLGCRFQKIHIDGKPIFEVSYDVGLQSS